MKGKAKYYIAAVLTIVFIVISYNKMFNDYKEQTIDYLNFKNNFKNNKEIIVYLDSEIGKTKDAILSGLNLYKLQTKKEYQILVYESLSETEKKELEELNERLLIFPAFAFIKNNELIAVRNGSYTPNDLEVLSNKYFNNIDVEIRYKVPANAEEFIKRAEKDEILMLVLGRTSCPACENFKITYNNLAEYYNIDIYYFDSDYYDLKEYNEVRNKEYIIPGYSSSHKDINGFAKCTNNGEQSTINSGFSTPTTIFIKNGVTVDCVLGSISTESLINTFEYNQVPLIN